MKRVLTALAATLPFAANAADAISGAVERQPTNWQAIIMFLIFVVFTLGITYWASKRVRSRNDYYTAGGNITGFQNGLAIAGDYMSAASFLGISALVITDSWPGQARTLFGDHERFEQTYFSTFKNMYFSGDGARRDEDGYYWITGRVDDVLNVSGHRLGTAEIESALVAHPKIAEAAVVGIPHNIKGQAIYAYVTLNHGEEPSPALPQCDS